MEEQIFNEFATACGEYINLAQLIEAIKKSGICLDDPRLLDFKKQIEKHQENQLDIETRQNQDIGRDEFHKIVKDSIDIISRALNKAFVVPEFKQFQHMIEEIYKKCKKLESGLLPEFIPLLKKNYKNQFAVSVCTIDGQRFGLGDCDTGLSLQACFKPIAYAAALTELGSDYVHTYVGREPSGKKSSEISLDSESRPFNPFTNAGAIMTVSLLKPEMPIDERFNWFLKMFRKASGDMQVNFSNSSYLSEKTFGSDRNNALAYFMKENNCYPKNSVESFHDSLDLYFQLSNLECSANALAVMGATLANGGVSPTKGERVFKTDMVKHVLSLMLSCGMYDYSGEFAFHTGIPAKSSISGALLVVIPNTCGICIWSPPLDKHGCSVRGLDFCFELIKKFNFHNFDSMLTCMGTGTDQLEKKVDPRKSAEDLDVHITQLLSAAKNGDLTGLRRFHIQNFDMDISDYDGRTALHVSACEGHVHCIEYLVKICHCNPHAVDRWGSTPLADAKRFGGSEAAECLEKYTERLSHVERRMSRVNYTADNKTIQELALKKLALKDDRRRQFKEVLKNSKSRTFNTDD